MLLPPYYMTVLDNLGLLYSVAGPLVLELNCNFLGGRQQAKSKVSKQ